MLPPSQRFTHLWPKADQEELLSKRANPLTAHLEAKGWRAWYAEIFGQQFIDSLDSVETDDKHQSEALEWHWESRKALLKGERPDYFAYFPIWSRANMKTTLLRAMVICDACLSYTAGQGSYALIPGGTVKKIRGTAISIEQMLHLPTLKQYYPKLSKVKRNPLGHSKGWTVDFLNTESNAVFHFVGLEEGIAGANIGDIRPSFICPDDIDDREDSPVISESRFKTFTTAVLPTRQANTLVFFAQNLISRFSCMYRIHKQQVRVLTNRKPTEPIPAVRGLKTETRTVDGIVKDIMVAGKGTWRGWNATRIQDEIDTYGLPAFLKECQHEVEESREGLVLQAWDDRVHVISRSQFASVFGTTDIPQHWYKYVFNDWARTKTKFHANVSGIVAASAQNSRLPGCVFMFHPMSFPAGAQPEDVAERMLTTIAPDVGVHGQRKSWRELIRTTLDKQGLENIVNTQELIEKRRSILAKVLPNIVHPILSLQNYVLFRASHDREDVRRVYRTVFGLPFQPANPTSDGGVDTLNLLMKVDYNSEHPFKQGEKGFSNFYLVVDDDFSKPVNLLGKMDTLHGLDTTVFEPVSFPEALRPDDLHDEDLFRYQMANWRFRDPYLTVKGEHEGEILKINDDFGQGLQMLFFDAAVRPAPLTKDETLVAMLPPALQPQAVAEEEPDKRSLLLVAQQIKARELRKELNRPHTRSSVRRYNQTKKG